MKLVRYGLFAVVGFVLWILLVEVLIRTFFPQAGMFHRLDSTYGYAGIPNKSGRYFNNSREFDGRFSMNRDGFRDVDHAIEKPAGVFRIIFFGDSFTEAKEVALEETYWRILQASLPALPDGRRVEVINMGVSGYGTGTELILLKNRALAWKPNLVVVAMTEFTDVWNNSPHLDAINDGRDPATRNKPYFRFESGNLEVLPFTVHQIDNSITGIFRRNFQTYMYLRKLVIANPALGRLAARTGVVQTRPPAPELRWRHPVFLDTFRTDIDTDAHWIEAWDLTKRIFLEIRRVSREAGVDLLVMTIPCQDQVVAAAREMEYEWYPDVRTLPMDWERPGNILSRFFQESGIDHLQLYPDLRRLAEQRPNAALYFKLDAHFRPEGHRAVAEILKRKIEGKYKG